MSETPSTPQPRHRKRWKRLAYPVYVALVIVAFLWAADRVAGVLLPEPDFPPNGLASPPLEDKTVDYVDFTFTSSTNSMGLRDAEIPPKSTHAFRIAAVGDSYVFGWGVKLEESWIKQLEKELRARGLDVEIVNVGQPGVGPLEYVRNARAAVAQLHPDMVLVGLLRGNDLNQCSLPTPFLWLNHYLPNLMRLAFEWDDLFGDPAFVPTDRMVQTKEEHNAYLQGVAAQMLGDMPPEARARYDRLGQDIKDLYLAGKINPWMIAEAAENNDCFTGVTDLEDPDTRMKINALGWFLSEIKDCAARAGASTLVLSVPNGVYDNRPLFERVQRLGYDVDPKILKTDAPDQAARMACEAAGVPLIVVTDVFHKRFDDPTLYFEHDHHFTPKGNRFYATTIAPYVEEAVRAQMGE
ncbi:hypothetical protein [Roseovarius pacificus]|uniref:hypothetical protein n=1 Tax=Roseovarius pacificus TaxID=337701 RepID=UPI002A188467|nr:hypothetical protein [Roseovarius pacificus]